MELKPLTPRIAYLPAQAETDRPVLGYIKGERLALMVDAGNSAAHVAQFNRAVQAAGLPLPDFAALTHWHWDHTFGMHALACRSIAGALTNAQLREVARWQWTDQAMQQRLLSGEDIEFCDTCIRLEYPDRGQIRVVTADLEFSGELVLDLGGIHAVLRSIPNPHAPDGVLVHVPEEGVLFIGDADCPDFYANQGRYDPQKLRELIALLESLDFATYVPGHDEPVSRADALSGLQAELAALEE